jgi:hypothetical protein
MTMLSETFNDTLFYYCKENIYFQQLQNKITDNL